MDTCPQNLRHGQGRAGLKPVSDDRDKSGVLLYDDDDTWEYRKYRSFGTLPGLTFQARLLHNQEDVNTDRYV